VNREIVADEECAAGGGKRCVHDRLDDKAEWVGAEIALNHGTRRGWGAYCETRARRTSDEQPVLSQPASNLLPAV
jgi:hypothetical protein